MPYVYVQLKHSIISEQQYDDIDSAYEKTLDINPGIGSNLIGQFGLAILPGPEFLYFETSIGSYLSEKPAGWDSNPRDIDAIYGPRRYVAFIASDEEFSQIPFESQGGETRAVDDFTNTQPGVDFDYNVTLNDTFADGTLLAGLTTGEAEHGTVSYRSAGEIRYTPDEGYTGTDRFTYTIEDSLGARSTATVSVTVGEPEPEKDPPEAVDDFVTVQYHENVSLNVLANDLPGYGTSLEITSISMPYGGFAFLTEDGTISYGPSALNPTFTGNDSFTYTITNAAGLSDTATIYISVLEEEQEDTPPFKDELEEEEFLQSMDELEEKGVNLEETDGGSQLFEEIISLTTDLEVLEQSALEQDVQTNATLNELRTLLDALPSIRDGAEQLSKIDLPESNGSVQRDLRLWIEKGSGGLPSLDKFSKGVKVLSFATQAYEVYDRLERGEDPEAVFRSEGGKLFVSLASGALGVAAGVMVTGAIATAGAPAILIGVGASLIMGYASEAVFGSVLTEGYNTVWDLSKQVLDRSFDSFTEDDSSASLIRSASLLNAAAASPTEVSPSWWFDPDSGKGTYLDQTNPELFESILATLLGEGSGVSGVALASVVDPAIGTASGDEITLVGGDGDAFGGAGEDRLAGSDGTNALFGGPGRDTLDGGEGNDHVSGDDGDDVLIGGSGADYLDGGNGNDTASYETATEGVFASLDYTFSHLRTNDAQGDILYAVENLIGSVHDDELHGDEWDNRLTGGAGADGLYGGDGMDTADYLTSAAGVKVDLRSGIGESGDAEGDILTGIENLRGSNHSDVLAGDGNANRLDGGGGGDRLEGRGGDDTIFGLGGGDWITPGAGSDSVDGGDGVDMISFIDLGQRVAVSLATGEATSGAAIDLIANVENITGSIYSDLIEGDAGDNRLRGMGGYDWFVGSNGADSYEGSNGRDMISYIYAAERVAIDLGAQKGLFGQAAGDVYDSIERATGSSFSDLFYGTEGEDVMRGMGGYDWFVGSGGGRDRYDGGSGKDTVSYAFAGEGVTASLALGYGSGGDAARDLYTSIENLTGSSFDDILSGDDGRNKLRGMYGEDTLYGGGGVDYLEGGGSDDVLYGGSGWDVAVFEHERADYRVVTAGDLTSVTYLPGGGEGTDLVREIEALSFADGMVYL